MSDYYVGEIRLFAGSYAPTGWHLCDGSSLSINTYQVLYSLIGTTWGGTATTFNLPDLRSRVAIGQGAGNGLTPRVIAQSGGSETVALVAANTPAHTHSLMAVNAPATTQSPSGTLPGVPSTETFYATNPASGPPNPTATLDPRAVTMGYGVSGASVPHENIMGSLGLTYIIALNGTYPTQN